MASDGVMSRLRDFVGRHPVACTAGAACVVAGVWLVKEALRPQQVFADEDGEKKVRFAAPETVQKVAEAVHKAHVEGCFTKSQLVKMYDQWFKEFGGDSLNFEQFKVVFERMGITDYRVVKSSFEAWDTDGDGTVDFSEMLNALAITSTGGLDDKLDLMFRAFDLNKDGVIEPNEMKHFYKSTLASIGVRKSDAEIKKLVALVFSTCDRNGDLCITFEEFREAARIHHFMLEDDLFDMFMQLMENSFGSMLRVDEMTDGETGTDAE